MAVDFLALSQSIAVKFMGKFYDDVLQGHFPISLILLRSLVLTPWTGISVDKH